MRKKRSPIPSVSSSKARSNTFRRAQSNDLVRVNVPEVPEFVMATHPVNLDKVISAEIWETGCWEPFETELFLASLSAGDTLIDVGANIGWYSILGALRVGVKGAVHAIEPDPVNYEQLLLNVALNGLSQVSVRRAAVGRRRGFGSLYRSPDNFGDHRTYAGAADEYTETIRVPLITLDDYVSKRSIRSLDLLKIDTQGAEADILRGFSSGLQSFQQQLVIITELWPYGLEHARATSSDVVQILAKERDLFLIDEDRRTLVILSPGQVIEYASRFLTSESQRFANLLAWPHSRALPPGFFISLAAPSWMTDEASLSSYIERAKSHRKFGKLFRQFPVPLCITFGIGSAGVSALATGWSKPEVSGVWTDGPEAVLILPLEWPVCGEVELILNCTAFLVPLHPVQRITVVVNGESCGSYRFTITQPTQTLTIPLHHCLSRTAPSMVVCRISVERPVSPLSAGVSQDSRHLGIMLTSLRLCKQDGAPTFRAMLDD